jgi:hypothetical protein
MLLQDFHPGQSDRETNSRRSRLERSISDFDCESFVSCNSEEELVFRTTLFGVGELTLITIQRPVTGSR